MAIEHKKRSVYSLSDFRGLDSENKKTKVAKFRATEGKNFMIDSNTLKTRPGLEFSKTFGFISPDDKLIDFFIKDNIEIIFTEKDIIIYNLLRDTKTSLIRGDFTDHVLYKNVSSSFDSSGRKPILREEKDVIFIFGLRRVYVLSFFMAETQIAYIMFYDLVRGKPTKDIDFGISEEAKNWYDNLPEIYEPTIAIGNNILDDVNLLSKVSKYKLFAHNNEKSAETYNILKMPTHYDAKKHGSFDKLGVTIDFYKDSFSFDKYKSYEGTSGDNLGFPVFLGIEGYNYFQNNIEYGSIDYGEIKNERPFKLKEKFFVKEDFEYILYKVDFEPSPEQPTPDDSDYNVVIGSGDKAKYYYREVSKQVIDIKADDFFKMLYQENVGEGDNQSKRIISVFEHVIETIQEYNEFDKNYIIRYEIPYRAKTRYIDYEKGLTLETGTIEDTVFVDVQYRIKEEIEYDFIYDKKDGESTEEKAILGTYDATEFPDYEGNDDYYLTNKIPYDSRVVNVIREDNVITDDSKIEEKVFAYINNNISMIEEAMGDEQTYDAYFGVRTQRTDDKNNSHKTNSVNYTGVKELQNVDNLIEADFDENINYDDITATNKIIKKTDNVSFINLDNENIDLSEVVGISGLSQEKQNRIKEIIESRRDNIYNTWVANPNESNKNDPDERTFLTKHFLYTNKIIPATDAVDNLQTSNLLHGLSYGGTPNNIIWKELGEGEENTIARYNNSSVNLTGKQVFDPTKTIQIYSNRAENKEYFEPNLRPTKLQLETAMDARVNSVYNSNKGSLAKGFDQKFYTKNYFYCKTKEIVHEEAENFIYDENTIETQVSNWKKMDSKTDTNFPLISGNNINYDSASANNKKYGPTITLSTYSEDNTIIKSTIKNTLTNGLEEKNPETIQGDYFYVKQNFLAEKIDVAYEQEIDPEDTYSLSFYNKSNAVSGQTKPTISTMRTYPIASPSGRVIDTDIVVEKSGSEYSDAEYVNQVGTNVVGILRNNKHTLDKGLNKTVYLKTYGIAGDASVSGTENSSSTHKKLAKNLAQPTDSEAFDPSLSFEGNADYQETDHRRNRTAVIGDNDAKTKGITRAETMFQNAKNNILLPTGTGKKASFITSHYKKNTIAAVPEVFTHDFIDGYADFSDEPIFVSPRLKKIIDDNLFKTVTNNYIEKNLLTTDNNFLNSYHPTFSLLDPFENDLPTGAQVDRYYKWIQVDQSAPQGWYNNRKKTVYYGGHEFHFWDNYDGLDERLKKVINVIQNRMIDLKNANNLKTGTNQTIYIYIFFAYTKGKVGFNDDEYGYWFFPEVYKVNYSYTKGIAAKTTYDLYKVQTDISYDYIPAVNSSYNSRSYHLKVDYDYKDEVPEVRNWYGKTAESKIPFETDGHDYEVIKTYGLNVVSESTYSLVDKKAAENKRYGTTAVIDTDFTYNDATYNNRLFIYPVQFLKRSEGHSESSITLKDLYDFYYNERSKTFDLKIKNYFYDFNNEPSIEVTIRFPENPDYQKIENSKFGTGFGTENRLILTSGLEKEPNIDYYNVSNNLLGGGNIPQSYEHTYFPSKNFRVVGDKTKINGYIVSNDSHLFITKDSKNPNDRLYVRERILEEDGRVRYHEIRTNVNKTAINRNSIVQFNNDIVLLDDTGLYGIELAENVQTNERLTRLRSPFINEELKKAIKNAVRDNIFIFEDNHLMFIVLGNVMYVADSRYFARDENGEVDNMGYEFVKWEFDNNIVEVKRVGEDIYLLDDNKTMYKLKEEKGIDEKARHIHSGITGFIDNNFNSESYDKITDYAIDENIVLPERRHLYKVGLYNNKNMYRKVNVDFIIENDKLFFTPSDLNMLYDIVIEMNVYVLETEINGNQNVLSRYIIYEISDNDYYIRLNKNIENFDSLYVLDDKLFKFGDYDLNTKKYKLKKKEETESVTLLAPKNMDMNLDIILYENKRIQLEWVSAILDFDNSMFEKTLFKTFVKGTKQDLGTELKIGITTMKKKDLYHQVERISNIESLLNFDLFDFNLFSISHFQEFGLQIPTKENNFLYIQFKLQADGSIEINQIDFLYKNNRMLKSF